MKQAGFRITKRTSRFGVSISKCDEFSSVNYSSFIGGYQHFKSSARRPYSVSQRTSDSQISYSERGFNQQLKNTSDPADIFSQQDEFTILRSLVFNRESLASFQKDMTSMRQKREHQKLLNNATSKSSRELDLSKLILTKNVTSNRFKDNANINHDKIRMFVSSPTRYSDSQDIINFIKIHTESTFSSENLTDFVEVMIENCNQYSFPAISQAMTQISSKISPDQLDKLITLLLTRALKVFPETTYVVEDGDVCESLGSDHLTKLEGLLLNSKYKDIYLRIVAKSGSLKKADELLMEYMEQKVPISVESIDAFFASLSRFLLVNQRISQLDRLEYNQSVKEAIIKYKSWLVARNITPSLIEFLLEHTSYLEEFHSLLNAIEESRHRDDILSQCQPKIIQAAVRCSLPFGYWAELESESTQPNNSVINNKREVKISASEPIVRTKDIYTKAMATMFGMLNRFGRSSAGITVEALDKCLVISARLGNSSGMFKALSLRLKNPDFPSIPKDTLTQVFDSFPLAQKGQNKEKLASPFLWVVNDAIIADSARDEIILFHLRNHLDIIQDSKIYLRYISALGRCRRVDLLLHEWDTAISPLMINDGYLENPYFQDIAMSLLAAFKTANSPESGLAILDALLHASTVSSSSHGFSLNVLTNVISHELLPLSSTLHHVTHWLLNNREATYWSDADVVRVYSHISAYGTLPDVSNMPSSYPNNQKGETSSIVGKLLSELVIQVRHGDDVDLALKHLEHTFGSA